MSTHDHPSTLTLLRRDESGHRERHGDPVVPVGVDGASPESVSADDREPVVELLALDPEGPEAGRHRLDPVRLLDAQL